MSGGGLWNSMVAFVDDLVESSYEDEVAARADERRAAPSALDPLWSLIGLQDEEPRAHESARRLEDTEEEDGDLGAWQPTRAAADALARRGARLQRLEGVLAAGEDEARALRRQTAALRALADQPRGRSCACVVM